jgi:hypothetical protein
VKQLTAKPSGLLEMLKKQLETLYPGAEVVRKGPQRLVPALEVKNHDAILLPGQYIWLTTSADAKSPTAMMFMCPCGCQKLSVIVLDNELTVVDPPPKWKWNGSISKPSFEQPIEKQEGCYFKGNLVHGVFVVRG